MFEKVDRDEVLTILQQWGALQPTEVRRKLGKGESTMIGAVLSELLHHKRIAITSMARGTSPFYYIPSKPESLENVAQYLGEKDLHTFQLLKEQKVIDPSVVDPLTRVSLGNIPDFSYPFEHEGKTFYRYFLVSEEQAKESLKPKRAAPMQEKTEVVQPEKKVEEKRSQVQEAEKETPAVKKTIPKKQEQEQKTLGEVKSESHSTIETDDVFMKRLLRYCKNKNITILSHEILRKGSEIDLLLSIPSTVGRMQYFCKAKSKKKSNDGDVAGALLAAQVNRLPAMYLTTGEVTKKAKEMTQKELKGVIIKEIKP